MKLNADLSNLSLTIDSTLTISPCLYFSQNADLKKSVADIAQRQNSIELLADNQVYQSLTYTDAERLLSPVFEKLKNENKCHGLFLTDLTILSTGIKNFPVIVHRETVIADLARIDFQRTDNLISLLFSFYFGKKIVRITCDFSKSGNSSAILFNNLVLCDTKQHFDVFLNQLLVENK